jgi:ribosomal protein L11 methyltransferase
MLTLPSDFLYLADNMICLEKVKNMHYPNKVQSYWLKISVITDPALVEALSDFLVGVMGAGVEIVVNDGLLYTTINAFLEKRNPDELQREYLLGQLTEYVRELAGIFQVPVPEIVSSVIDEEDWGSTWKEHFKPFVIIPGLVIKPTWEEYQPGADEKIIEMDPGMAFGTGHHATTTLSLELLQAVLADQDAERVLDVGTGTGILGMAAALFGADRVVGIDNDPEAIAAAFENVRRNGLEQRMSVALTPLSILQGSYSIIIANIIHDVLLSLAGDLDRLIANGGTLILSGILTGEQSDTIIEHFSDRGFSLMRHLQQNEWSALLLNKQTEKT